MVATCFMRLQAQLLAFDDKQATQTSSSLRDNQKAV